MYLPFFLFFYTLCPVFQKTRPVERRPQYTWHRRYDGGAVYRGIWSLFHKYLEGILAVSGTIHYDEEPLYYHNLFDMRIEDGSFRFTTAGVQVMALVGYSPLNTEGHELQVRAGPFVRYQSSSLPAMYSITYENFGGYSTPRITIANRDQAHNFITTGYSVQVQYRYTTRNDISAGLIIGFQNDTVGDAITLLGLSVGKRF